MTRVVSTLLRLAQLLLPVLFPSWRFFREVAESPRIELRGPDGRWTDLTARPSHLPPGAYLRRLFWNRRWNEYLFLMSLSDRLAADPSPELLALLRRRIEAWPGAGPGVTFRLVFVSPEDRYVAYVSAPPRASTSRSA